MARKPGEERPSKKVNEIEIQIDSLTKLDPIIASVANDLFFENHCFKVREDLLKRADSYAWFNVFIINPRELNAQKKPVGAFTLHLVESNRAILRVPPRSDWRHGFTPEEKISLGLIERGRKAGSSKSNYDEYFKRFIKELKERLTDYDLIVTRQKRVWRWIKSNKILSIIIGAITLIAAIITILGFASGFFS
jgi:hypothetical protein